MVLAGDVFYEKPLAEQLIPWFSKLSQRGAASSWVIRARNLSAKALQQLAVYTVPVTRALEDAEVKRTTVWALVKAKRFAPATQTTTTAAVATIPC